MRPEMALSGRWTGSLLSLTPVWRAALLRLALANVVLFALLFRDWAAIADQAWNISTYNHILLIPPILVWLTSQRLPQALEIEPQGWWPGLVLAGGAMLVWVLGALSGLDLLRQTGAVGLMIATVPALLGPRVSVAFLFPLCFAALLVPFGDELIPPLQMVTAAIVIFLTEASGIPAFIQGVFIDTPAGLFEVAEACSGVKFLIAMIAFGILVGNVCFVSWPRRIAFFAACVIVPVLANGVRAWATVMAAQYVGIKAAGSFDHIVYGWIFFAVVIALVIAGGWRFFDRPGGSAMIDVAAIRSSTFLGTLARMRIGAWPALLSLAAICALGTGWAHAAGTLSAPVARQIDLPAVPGWTRTDYAPRSWWEPRATGADHRLLGRYTDAKGRSVDVFYALYGAQGEGREAGGFGEGALMPDSQWSWQGDGPVVAGARSDRLFADDGTQRLVLTWYRTGTTTTGSNLRLKLAVITDRLALRARPTALLILSAEKPGQGTPVAALRDFLAAAGPVDAWMDRIGGVE